MTVEEKLKTAEQNANNAQYDLALNIAQEVLAEGSEDLIQARAQCVVGFVHMRRGDNRAALEIFQKAQASYTAQSDRLNMAKCDSHIGVVYFNLADYTTAMEYYDRAQKLFTDLGDQKGIAIVLQDMSSVYRTLGDFPKALELNQRALQLYQELGEMENAATIIGNMAGAYLGLSDYPQALECCQRALAMHEEMGMKSEIARDTMNLGIVHKLLAEYVQALECYSKALAICDELGEQHSVAIALMNIGNVYQELADHTKGLQYYHRALTTFEQQGDMLSIAHSYGNIGRCYLIMGEYTTALDYYQRALRLHEDLGIMDAVINDYANIGEVYYRLGDYPSSFEFCERALSLYKQNAKPAGIAEVTQQLAQLYATPDFERYDPLKATAMYEQVLKLWTDLGSRQELPSIHLALSKLYEQNHRIAEAFDQFKKYHESEASVFSREAKQNAELLDAQRKEAEQEKVRIAEQAAAEARSAEQLRLLHRILPESVAERLLRGEKIADYFPHISILFADIVGFTPIAARMPAKAVLAFLNYVFGEFDRIMKHHGCQKIKTIGDGYMAVCGAPIECSDHAERIARAAKEMMSGIVLPDEIRKHLPKNATFHLRIGLHTGSAFAGIVGEEGFVYDVYSDAVNLASRMESSGEAGRIHCSTDLAMHLQNRDDSFTFEEREGVEVKGKGTMVTYFLV